VLFRYRQASAGLTNRNPHKTRSSTLQMIVIPGTEKEAFHPDIPRFTRKKLVRWNLNEILD
jgi:hypothetical protein